MSDPLSRAMADLSTKEAAMKELQAEIDRLRSFVAMYRSYDDHAEEAEGKRSKKDIMGDAAIALIKENGPMSLSALYAAIEGQGIEIGTKNPKQYLSTTFNRDRRLKFVDGKGWMLARNPQ
ncbi:hypothetical protein [Methylosinus sp. Ce-a6]|uniref:hypothetical protein n=1 Tax=Methylosinus sp. Ce-a6 TaxID=2172005 RepID=UPI00135A87F1|nr:hypothetical protein [Methylosinus sp. Ce-a6]